MKLQIQSVCVWWGHWWGRGGLSHSWALSRTLLYSTAPVHRGLYCPNIDSAWLGDVTTGLRNELLILVPVPPLTFLFQLKGSL